MDFGAVSGSYDRRHRRRHENSHWCLCLHERESASQFYAGEALVCVAFLIGREWVERKSKKRSAATEDEAMGEEVEKHILRKYELLQKLGKGVSPPATFSSCMLTITKSNDDT